MHIQANSHSFHPFRHHHRGATPGAAQADGLNSFLLGLQSREAGEALQGAWASLLGMEAPRLLGVQEMGRNQSTALNGRGVSVDGSGGMNVGNGGAQTAALLAVSGPGGSAVAVASTSGGCGPGGLRIAGGQLLLPDGRSIPFGNRGVIVRMPDGSQVAVGRSGDGKDAQACRWAVAGPGEDIPTSPPGATSVYDWDGAGRLTPAGVE